ncbi:hypothetical protein [Nocardia brasiliensis]|uniref:hypothetical protein n=1 Tax=Nocardia brasiliensis TaxID=37326 RepID=UPI0004A76D7B|nr:hypothetical protein [Nocardia brasiliensis]
MSDAENHRAAAESVLSKLRHPYGSEQAIPIASEATARVLLAIEARLGELVDEQRKANVLAAYESRVIKDDSEFRQAEHIVRAVLGLSNTPEGQPE